MLNNWPMQPLRGTLILLTADMVDRIDVEPTADMVPDEIPISLVNFKRRSGGNKLNTQLDGYKKKRRLIRPSLELEDEDNNVHALNGQKHNIAMSSEKQSEEPYLVSIESIYNGENMVITDALNVEGQVDDANSEILDGSHGPFLINSQSKGSDVYFKAESLGSFTGEYRDENNEISVMMEIESQQQKHEPEDSYGPLCNTEICLKNLPEPIISESKIELIDKCVLEVEPDNLTISVCLHKEEVNLVEEFIPLEPEPDDMKIDLFSHNEMNNPVEEFIALEADTDNY
jgi:hypothetical protein